MTKKEIMIRAHELARQMIGDYRARLALGLRQAWREARQPQNLTARELAEIAAEKLEAKGFRATVKQHSKIEGRWLVYVKRRLSRGWQEIGYIRVENDGYDFGPITRNQAGIRNLVSA